MCDISDTSVKGKGVTSYYIEDFKEGNILCFKKMSLQNYKKLITLKMHGYWYFCIFIEFEIYIKFTLYCKTRHIYKEWDNYRMDTF
jgi:hypothetical protein